MASTDWPTRARSESASRSAGGGESTAASGSSSARSHSGSVATTVPGTLWPSENRSSTLGLPETTWRFVTTWTPGPATNPDPTVPGPVATVTVETRSSSARRIRASSPSSCDCARPPFVATATPRTIAASCRMRMPSG